jgi:mannose-6-phosphate isomerase-like protein (cupin superfamily)
LKRDRAAADEETHMKGYVDDIEQATLGNTDFRRVLYTGEHLQLVLMTLQPGEEIGEEVHEDRDQFFRIEKGAGEVLIDGKTHAIEDDHAVIVPAGARHNVRNTGDAPLKLYTIYGPPEHRDGVVHKDKAQAERDHDDDEWDGETTE